MGKTKKKLNRSDYATKVEKTVGKVIDQIDTDRGRVKLNPIQIEKIRGICKRSGIKLALICKISGIPISLFGSAK